MKNNDLEQRYINMINTNTNVSETSSGLEFVKLLTGVIVVCFLVYLFAGNIANIIIDSLPTKTQLKIEHAIFLASSNSTTPNTDKLQIKKLEIIKDKIVSLDKNLQNKSKFNIYETSKKEVNAFVFPDGSIFVTKGLLEEINDEEMLTFIIAHELGHYAHRDHLKMLARQIIASTVLSTVSGNERSANSTIKAVSSINELKYSRSQERNADKYANKMLYKIYGNNDGAVKFFQYLEKEENAPEFMQYFSTHPSTKQRLKFIQK